MSNRSSTRGSKPTKRAGTLSVAAPATKRRRKDSSGASKIDSPAGITEGRSSARDVVKSVVMVQVPEGFSLSQAACR